MFLHAFERVKIYIYVSYTMLGYVTSKFHKGLDGITNCRKY